MMRGCFGQWILAAALLFSGAASAQLQMAQPWNQYRPEGGRFSVEMPGIPRVTMVQVPIPGGRTVPMAKATAVAGRVEGREYAVVQANGNVAITRIYWARGRLFQLVVDGRTGVGKLPETRKFMESFAFVTEQR